MKGSGGNRAFDPSAEAYRQAYLDRHIPVVETTNLPRYQIAQEEEKLRGTIVTIPVERPGMQCLAQCFLGKRSGLRAVSI